MAVSSSLEYGKNFSSFELLSNVKLVNMTYTTFSIRLCFCHKHHLHRQLNSPPGVIGGSGYEIFVQSHVTSLYARDARWNFPRGFKNMADNEGDENFVVQQTATVLFNGETSKSEFCYDENTPLSPGEVCMMRNHPKVASVLFSPSRTTRGGEGKLKPKSFSTNLYASPTRKTVGSLALPNSVNLLCNIVWLMCFFLCDWELPWTQVILNFWQKPNVVDKEKRKTLQVLQPTASGDGTLVGSRGVVRRQEMVRSICSCS